MITRADHVTAEQIATMDGRQQLADEIALRKTQPASEQSVERTVVTLAAPAAPAATEA